MYQVLYRKWRPRTFSDVCGQPYITKALQNEVRENQLAHAYLFIGSRGTGKTSCAKILAKAVNCLHPQDGDPCNECDCCRGIDDGSILDVVEIDAASNNGVDSIRDLREAVNFTPAVAKYRVYIIDEVHMLSDGAFNALLKTLEEPPPHVIFILATTEVHKLPATILSRCQRFDFSRIAPEDIAARLQTVANGEDFILDPPAATLLARLADGAMRDALSLTDQCLSRSRHITVDVVAEATGLAGREHLYFLSNAVHNAQVGAAFEEINRLYAASQDMGRLCSEWLEFYRELMLCKTVTAPERMIAVTDEELQRLKKEAEQYDLPTILHAIDVLKATCASLALGGNKRMEAEMAALRIANPVLDDTPAAMLQRIAELESAVAQLFVEGVPTSKSTSGAAVETAAAAPAAKPDEPIADPSPAAEAPAPKKSADPSAPAATSAERPFTDWPEVLARLSSSCPPLYGVLEKTTAGITDTHIIIYTSNPLFQTLVQNGSNKSALTSAIAAVTGRQYRIGIRAEQTAESPEETDPLKSLLQKGIDGGVDVTFS